MEETSVPSVDEIYFDCKKKVDYEKLEKLVEEAWSCRTLQSGEKGID